MLPAEAEYLIAMGKLDPSTITDPEIHRWLSMRTVMKQRLVLGVGQSCHDTAVYDTVTDAVAAEPCAVWTRK